MKRIVFAFLYILYFLVLFSSCDGQRKKKAQDVVARFQQAYKNDDIHKMAELYPNISKLKGYTYKTDEFIIKGCCVLPSKNILVFGENKWTNPFGKLDVQQMRFFVREENKGNEKAYKIFDSKNFINCAEDKLYTIARRIGAINLAVDTTDISISLKIASAQPIVEQMTEKIKKDIIDNVSINNDWHLSDYFNDASGRCTFSNNSNFPIKNPKVILEFRAKKNGKIVSTSEERICYGWLSAGETRSCSWYVSNVGNVSWCRGRLDMDNVSETAEEILNEFPFTGNEYSQFNNVKTWNN